MATKLKDYYNIDYAYSLAEKIKNVHPLFDEECFMSFIETDLESLKFKDRQLLLAHALKEAMHLGYEDSIVIFYQILGPELKSSLGMFTEGWWLWPIGQYVELYGYTNFKVSTSFSKELTKRFTGEFCMRPIIEYYPNESMNLLLKWSKDENKRVRRLASECLRIRLPWAKKLYLALDHFDDYKKILNNLKDDTDKTIQKSVANNLNDPE